MSPTQRGPSWVLIALSVALIVVFIRPAAKDAARVALDLSNPDPNVRLQAVRTAGKTRPLSEQLVDALVARLCDPKEDSRVRNLASSVLRTATDRSAVGPLVRMLSADDHFARETAASALGKIGDPRAIQPLVPALTDPSEVVRFRAAEALAGLADQRGVRYLVGLLSAQDVHLWERSFSARVLGELGEKSALPALRKALTDRDTSVCQAAAEAIKQIEARQK